MRRYHLFEFGGQRWCPAVLRDCLTDYLDFIVAKTAPYVRIQPQLAKAIKRSGAARVVDLCSGGGGPWALGEDINGYSGGIDGWCRS